jgi:cyclophilin family peptidyl-prolyl cis-trans isomerase
MSYEADTAVETNMPQAPAFVEAPKAQGFSAQVAALFGVVGMALAAAAAHLLQKKPENKTVGPARDPRAHWAVGLGAAAAVAAPATFVPPAAMAGLPSSDPIGSPQALLRYALPIKNPEIRKIQGELESISRQLRIPGSKPLGPIKGSVDAAARMIDDKKIQAKIVKDFAPDKAEEGMAAIAAFKESLVQFNQILQDGDKQAIPFYQEAALDRVGDIEEAMVKGFPFEVPAKYARLPQLKGRAAIEMKVTFFDNVELKEAKFVMVADGYNAPVSAGNFVDLVNKGFYDGLTIQRADGFVVQTGDPDGKADGYVDPATGEIRTIPVEVKVAADKEPFYEQNLEDLGIYAPVSLPFNAFGSMAMARKEFENNSASSQIFWLLKDSELTPVGNNVLDGRYACFGYITENQDLLKEMKVGDKIEYMKVIAGGEFLQPGNPDAPPVEFEF